jgi:hypothetical protein
MKPYIPETAIKGPKLNTKGVIVMIATLKNAFIFYLVELF